MSPNEVLRFRLPQFIQIHIKGHYQSRADIKALKADEFFVGPQYDRDQIKNLFNVFPFKNWFKVFTEEIDVLSFEEWRKDISTGINSPISYYGHISKQDFEKNGDVKFISEISRMEFLPFLAFKYIDCNETRYLHRIQEILDSWEGQNPYLKSINWTSGIEVGIRAVNLIYTHHILRSFQILPQELDRTIVKIISCSYQFLKNHLSLYSSANNHLMAELMGLTVIGSYFKVSDNEFERWKTMFFEQIQKQINNDGVNMELCTRYHAEVTDQVLIGLTFVQGTGNKVPSHLWKKFQKMFQFTQHVDYLGNETIFGDNDEGSVINPFFDKGFSLFRSQLKSSNYLFQTKYRSDGLLDFRNYLIFGSEFNNETIFSPESDTLFDDSGYCFMYDHNSKAKLSFDCGPIGDEISAAHGHSDILHFNFEVGGVPFIIDSGTYQYHSKYEQWRNYFKGIKAHNTISINGKDHAINNGRMSWVERPKTLVESYEVSRFKTICKATTNAFEKEGVRVSRNIEFNKEQKKITVSDIIFAEETVSYQAQFFLHFHPSITICHKGCEIVAQGGGKKIVLYNEFFDQAEVLNTIREEDSFFGWYSEQYNIKQKASSLNLSLKLTGKHIIETKINYD